MEIAHQQWGDAARKAGVDFTGFSEKAPLAARVAWAKQRSLGIGVVYARYSSKHQHSTEDQVRVCVEGAAKKGIYVPPEFLCVDEAVSGRRNQRDGLSRAKRILHERAASIFIVFKLSRLTRTSYQGGKFLNEDIVDEGLRAISVADDVDTNDKRSWRIQTGLRGIMDEEFIEIVSDHVREGLTGLFLKGWTTGALPVGYMPKLVEEAPKTRRNLPRTMPAIDPKAADLIRQHFELIANGMDISEELRRWRAANGPVDPRSTTEEMRYYSYRRMLAREAYTGRWKFGRKRNRWSAKRDTVQQIQQPEAEVKVATFEELRIVSDEIFHKVQEILSSRKIGPRSRRKKDPHQLWDLAIGLFVCEHCNRRFHMAGSQGRYMRCPNMDCPARAMVLRKKAVTVICDELKKMLLLDGAIIDDIVTAAVSSDSRCSDEVDTEILAKQNEIRALTARIRDLEDLLGSGDEEERRRRRANIIALDAQRSGLQSELATLQRRRNNGSNEPITRQQVEHHIQDILGVLNDATTGKLEPDVVGKGLDIFRNLVGGQIKVHAQRRLARKDWIVTGVFVPNLIGTLQKNLGGVSQESKMETTKEVFLVPPPFVDRIADEIRHLYDVEKKGFRVIADILNDKYKKNIGSGNCCAAYRRWYEMHNLLWPEPKTNTGRPRKNKAA
ncbi:MAG: recombinase family protein [Phycisphaerales bacterium]|nr:recombinase family protein [Phycisphaerales bacterium]